MTEGVVEPVDNSTVGGAVVRRVAANERATVTETSQVQVQRMPPAEAERRLLRGAMEWSPLRANLLLQP